MRDTFAAFIRNGGGLVANHSVTVTSPGWAEFCEILGARGAAHRSLEERILVKLDDPSHPINRVFGGKGFEFTEDILRFDEAPSPRSKVHVLLSIDVAKTDMNQGRCTGNCVSDDGEYPLSWVRGYGKGRVFYCSLGHKPSVVLGCAPTSTLPGRHPVRLGRPEGQRQADGEAHCEEMTLVQPSSSGAARGGSASEIKRRLNMSGRRDFLKSLAGGVVAGFPTIVPSSALGRDGFIAPSDKIVMGAIGVGNMGFGDMRGFLSEPEARIVAVCDVQQARQERAETAVNTRYGDNGCKSYYDFRELLERPDIDAVMISTGERWHSLVTIAAANRGKHMLTEKPLGLSVAEFKAVREAVTRNNVTFQFGTEARAFFSYRHAVELVRNKRIGELKTIMAAANHGPTDHLNEQPKDPPPGFDYDMWLGPSPWSPYSDMRVSFAVWMFISDYGLGCLDGAWGIHEIDIAQWVADADNTGPIDVEGTCTWYTDLRDTPYEWTVEHTYANGVRLINMDMFTAKKRASQFYSLPSNGATVMFGTEGWIYASREGIVTDPPSLATEIIGPNQIQVIRTNNHRRNWLNAIRTGQQPVCPLEAAVRSQTVAQQAYISLRLGPEAALGSGCGRIHRRRGSQPHAQPADAESVAPMKRLFACLILLALAVAPFAARAAELSAEDKEKIDQALPAKAPAKPKRARRLLVLNYNVHDLGGPPLLKPSIPHGNYALMQMGLKTGAYTAVLSTDIEALRPENLKQYDALCFNNTTGVITKDQALRDSLLAFVADGKGFVAFYAGAGATFVPYPAFGRDQFPAFGEMVGGYMDGGHPWGPKQETYYIRVEDPKNPVNAVFKGQGFPTQDWVIQFRNPYSRENLHVLLSIDVEKSDYDPVRRHILPERQADKDFPMAWIKRYHKGRVYYSGFGATPPSFWNPQLLQHYLAGIQYALGDLKADDTPGARLAAKRK